MDDDGLIAALRGLFMRHATWLAARPGHGAAGGNPARRPGPAEAALARADIAAAAAVLYVVRPERGLQ
jgi:hypothetical protein